MGRAYLGEFEEIVLLTVAVLQTDAYGVTIAAELNRRKEKADIYCDDGGQTHAL